jgi:pimeloyl-ACP methyl ester carboxylesterase
MTDYVLIHGAWHGSWCWAHVRRLLAAGAHRVFTPTLTGVGERSHLLSRDVDLDTHIADAARLLPKPSCRNLRKRPEQSFAKRTITWVDFNSCYSIVMKWYGEAYRFLLPPKDR